MRRKIILCLFVVLLTIMVTGCDTKKEEINNNENKNNQEQQNTSKEEKENKEQNNSVIIDDEIIEFDDDDNQPYIKEEINIEKVTNCDGCVYSYFSEEKSIGSTLSEGEYTNDVTTLKTNGGKQRHNFFGFVLSDNKISRAYSCILKDTTIYCIEGSVDGRYHDSNIGILNQIFTADQCKYISNGHTYTCTDGSYNGDTITTGYASMHYETSCTIHGANAKTGKLDCN